VKTEYRLTAATQKGKGEQAMIVEYIRYKIDEPRRADFEKAYQDAGASLDASSHCQAYELAQCTEAKESYVLRIEWDSEEGHTKGFRSSSEFKTFFAAIQPYVKDIEEMRHYQLTSAKKRK
jgi:quinol monooxygenase YgiN